MRLKEALELARVNELAMRDAYAEMAELVAGGHAGLRQTFLDMSRAEATHAHVFANLVTALDEDILAGELELSAAPLRRQIKTLVEFRERIKTVAVTLDEVFCVILELEIGEQNGFLLALIDAAGGELGATIRNDIARPGEQHIRPVLDAIDTLAEDPSLRERAQSIRRTLDWFAAK